MLIPINFSVCHRFLKVGTLLKLVRCLAPRTSFLTSAILLSGLQFLLLITGNLLDEDAVLNWMTRQKTDESIEDIDREKLFEYIDIKEFLAVVFCKCFAIYLSSSGFLISNCAVF